MGDRPVPAGSVNLKEQEKKGAKKQLRNINIKPAANGFTVDCDYRMMKNGKEIYDYGNPIDNHVFEKKKDVVAFIEKELS